MFWIILCSSFCLFICLFLSFCFCCCFLSLFLFVCLFLSCFLKVFVVLFVFKCVFFLCFFFFGGGGVLVCLFLFLLFLRGFLLFVFCCCCCFSSVAQIDLACFRQLHSNFENHIVHETLLCLHSYLRKRCSFLSANASEQVVIHNIKKMICSHNGWRSLDVSPAAYRTAIISFMTLTKQR